MSTMVLVNFPVKDLTASTAFYEKLGFKKNPMFSDKEASCMAWDELFIIMLLSHEHYKNISESWPVRTVVTPFIWEIGFQSQ